MGNEEMKLKLKHEYRMEQLKSKTQIEELEAKARAERQKQNDQWQQHTRRLEQYSACQRSRTEELAIRRDMQRDFFQHESKKMEVLVHHPELLDKMILYSDKQQRMLSLGYRRQDQFDQAMLEDGEEYVYSRQENVYSRDMLALPWSGGR